MPELNAKDRRQLERVIRQVKREAEREWRTTREQEGKTMGIGDILLIIFIPPLASGVRERGCGTMLLVTLLWCLFWIPGSIAAFIMTSNKNKATTEIHVHYDPPPK